MTKESEETSPQVSSDAGHLLSTLDELEDDFDQIVKRVKLAFSQTRSVAASALTQRTLNREDD